MYHEPFMKQALMLSSRAIDTPGTEPFGAIVVLDGQVVGEGLNHSAAHFDPTSHGEIEAIRDACRRLRRLDLQGCDLYSSCEPCALCVAAMRITGVRKLYYAATLTQSRSALGGLPSRRRVDVAELRADAGAPVGSGLLPAEQRLADEAVGILVAWRTAQRDGNASDPADPSMRRTI